MQMKKRAKKVANLLYFFFAPTMADTKKKTIVKERRFIRQSYIGVSIVLEWQ